jgi:hypothetical protein
VIGRSAHLVYVRFDHGNQGVIALRPHLVRVLARAAEERVEAAQSLGRDTVPAGSRPSAGVSQVRQWLAVDVGIAGVVMVAAGKSAALELVLVTVGVLSGLPLLFLTVFSRPHQR